MEGYQQYVASHPEADYSGIQEDFCNYLHTAEAQEIIKNKIAEIIQSTDGVTVTVEQLRNMLTEIMSGYQQYVNDNGLTDPNQFDEYLIAYMQTQEAQNILNKWASEIFGGISDSITITGNQLSDLASALGVRLSELRGG